jgi:hypothetical protein
VNVDSTLVSEFARVEDGGNLTVVNVFNQFTAERFPALLPSLYLSLIIHASVAEAGTSHDLDVHFLNHRRERLGSEIRSLFDLPDGPALPGVPLRACIVVSLVGWEIPEPGPYAFEVFIDGTYSAGTVLYAGPADAA